MVSLASAQDNTAQEKRRVDLILLFSKEDVMEHIVVADNGKGMDEKAIKSYATYNDSQEARQVSNLRGPPANQQSQSQRPLM